MTHDELLEIVKFRLECAELKYLQEEAPAVSALLAVVALHRPEEIKLLSGEVADTYCFECEGLINYPCPTIQAIEKELR